MKRTMKLATMVAAIGLVVCLTQLTWAVPMGTAYTYQGRLIEGDEAGNGLYDFEFKLFDDPCTGTQQGGTVRIDELDVIDGYFTVELDFGGVFDGHARWLEINVRPSASVGPYTTLIPRQEVTPTPYALYAQSAEDANTVDGLHAKDFAPLSHSHSASSITSGTLSTARYSAFSDLTGEGYLGNASGDIAQNNGVIQSNLNADRLDGFHASSFMTSVTDYGRSGVSSNLYEGTTALVNKYLGISATAVNSDMVDGFHASSFASSVHNHNTLYYTQGTSDGRYVNVTGDTMTGELNMNTTGTSIDIVASPAASTTYGVRVNADQSAANNYTIYGLYSDTDSSASSASAYGMYSNVRKETGTGNIYGGYNYAYHNGTGGYTYGTYSYASGSDEGITYGILATGHKDSTDTGGTAYGGYLTGDNDSSGNSYGVYGRAVGSDGTNYGVYGYASGGTTNYAGYFSGEKSYFSGDVGIGTTTPDYKLEVNGTMGTSADASGKLRVGRYSADYPNSYISASGSAESMRLQIGDSTKMVITSSGNVGIGTDSPTERLTIRGGNLLIERSDGTDIVELGEGLDYAEGFDVSAQDKIEPGSVLVIDADNPGKLALSNTSYDTKVAGIVAGAKGLGSGVRLGAGQFDYDVALAGRVHCKVDATKEGVKPGDLLTTSATPGYAMKASDYTHAQGAILGKAMESIEKGQKGQILVLVTLQ